MATSIVTDHATRLELRNSARTLGLLLGWLLILGGLLSIAVFVLMAVPLLVGGWLLLRMWAGPIRIDFDDPGVVVSKVEWPGMRRETTLTPDALVQVAIGPGDGLGQYGVKVPVKAEAYEVYCTPDRTLAGYVAARLLVHGARLLDRDLTANPGAIALDREFWMALYVRMV